MNTVLSLVALAVLGAFLAVMIWHVTRADLVTVTLVTFGFAAFDLFRSSRKRKNK